MRPPHPTLHWFHPGKHVYLTEQAGPPVFNQSSNSFLCMFLFPNAAGAPYVLAHNLYSSAVFFPVRRPDANASPCKLLVLDTIADCRTVTQQTAFPDRIITEASWAMQETLLSGGPDTSAEATGESLHVDTIYRGVKGSLIVSSDGTVAFSPFEVGYQARDIYELVLPWDMATNAIPSCDDKRQPLNCA